MSEKNAKQIENLAELIARDFSEVLQKHGLQNFEVTNFNLIPSDSAFMTETAGNGTWVWKCWTTPHGVKCGWIWETN